MNVMNHRTTQADLDATVVRRADDGRARTC